MNRREFLSLAAGVSVTFNFLPHALAVEESLNITINRNHGHGFQTSLKDLLQNGPQIYNIKGTSSHPHQLEITQEILDTLLVTRIVDVESSVDAGHAHLVRLQIVEA